MLNLLEEEPIVTEIKSDVTVPKGELTLSDVTFGISECEEKHFEKLLLQIKENTIVGILGQAVRKIDDLKTAYAFSMKRKRGRFLMEIKCK